MLLTGTRIFTKSPLFVAPFSYSLFYEYRDVHRCLSHWPGRPVGEGAGLMNYSVLPPEINSLRMFTGAGSAPMLAASVAWDRLAAELAVAASSFGSVTSGFPPGDLDELAAGAHAGVHPEGDAAQFVDPHRAHRPADGKPGNDRGQRGWR